MSARYIRETAALSALCERAAVAGRFGLDTEFIRDRTYYPKLALVQVAVEDEIVLIDPLAGLSLDPLNELMGDASVWKILHAAGQDLEIFYLMMGRPPAMVFDTQVAAALCGLGRQVSYAQVVGEVLGIEIGKGERFTDWLKRPLTPDQEQYAAADVEHLLPLHDALLARVADLDREHALSEELSRLTAPSNFEVTPDDLVKRIKGRKGLQGTQREILKHLAAWREEQAQKRDIPRRWVVGDETLVALAQRAPQTSRELRQIRGLHAKEAERSGRELLQAISSGLAEPAPARPAPRKARIPANAAGAVDLAKALVKVMCKRADVAPTMVASASDIEALVAEHLNGGVADDHPLLEGWRGDIIEPLLDFLDGKLAIRLGDDGTPELVRD